MLKASIVAASVFALAWIRMDQPLLGLGSVVRIFIGYGLLIVILSLVLGLPLVAIAEKFKFGRWWSYTAVAASIGALLPAVLTSYQTNDPFAITFSPWTRDSPGFAGDVPVSPIDYVGSIAFGAIVGGMLGIAFWYFYSRRTRSNNALERP